LELLQLLYGQGYGKVYVFTAFCLPKPTPTPPPPPSGEIPCPGSAGENGVNVTCGARYGYILVSLTAPCPLVDRQPAPRGLVSLLNLFQVMPPTSGLEAWSNYCQAGLPESNIRNFQIGLRWVRLATPARWLFDERPWNIGRSGNEATGDSVQHVYETSSWGKPANGPSLSGTFDLPAYQVNVETSWAAQWATRWEAYECVETETVCNYTGNPEESCRGRSGWAPAGGNCIRHDWVAHFNGWHALDLTRYGYPTWYFLSRWVSSGNPFVLPPNVCVRTIPVPVIESQSVLER